MKSTFDRFPTLQLRALTAAVLGVLAAGFTVQAADWPQWRGPNRDGHAAGVVNSLPKESKPVWKNPIGTGFSAPIVIGGRLIYLDAQGKKGTEETNEMAHCLDAATGHEIWATPYAMAEGDEWGTGPRMTPFAEGGHVYFQSMNGEFRCLNLTDGKVVWGFNFNQYGIKFSTKTTDGTAARRGNNGSGIVDGDYVYVPVGAKGASIVCLDKLTGREVWKTGNDEAAYASYLVVPLAGTRQLVAFTADALMGLDLKTGATLWRMPFKTAAKRHAASPVIDGDTITVNSQTIGLARVAISKSPGGFTVEQKWVNKPLTINLATPVLAGGHLYSYGAIRTKDYVCVDAANGETKWTRGGLGIGKDQTDYASTIAVGKNLLILTYDGQLILIAANPAQYTELGRLQVCGKTWSHPAFADGKIYIRGSRDLQCLDLSGGPMANR